MIQSLEGTTAYIDDLVVVADEWKDHMTRLRLLFERLQRVGLTLNLAKSHTLVILWELVWFDQRMPMLMPSFSFLLLKRDVS